MDDGEIILTAESVVEDDLLREKVLSDIAAGAAGEIRVWVRPSARVRVVAQNIAGCLASGPEPHGNGVVGELHSVRSSTLGVELRAV